MVLFGDIDWYAFGKDYCLPLLAPLIAIVVPSILFYVIPARQNRRKTAMDFFNSFFAEEMRQTRLEAWRYFVTDRKQLVDTEQTKRLFDYVTYTADQSIRGTIAPETVREYQGVSRVLHFFALVDTCLQAATVDETMIRSFLGWDYLLWRDEVLIPLRRLNQTQSNNPKAMPIWLKEFMAFDRVCGVPN